MGPVAISPHDIAKNRYIPVAPDNSARQVKIDVTLSAGLPQPGPLDDSWWVRPPVVPQVEQLPKPLLGPGECVAILGAEATAAQINWEAAGCQDAPRHRLRE